MIAGVTADGLEASRHRESFTFGKIAANSSAIPFDVTDSVQAWVNGAPNYRLGVHQHRRQRLGLLHARVRRRQATSQADRRVHAAEDPSRRSTPTSTARLAQAANLNDFTGGDAITMATAARHLERRPRALPPPDPARHPAGRLARGTRPFARLVPEARGRRQGRGRGRAIRAQGDVGHPHLPPGRLRPHGQLRPEARCPGRVSRHPRRDRDEAARASASARTCRRPPRSPTS